MSLPTMTPPAATRFDFNSLAGSGDALPNNREGTAHTPFPRAEQIYVVPYSWVDSPWWSDDQVGNLRNILDALKRSYNVDENRVVVSGVSDGGTGAYYIGMRDTTPYASFLALNGFIMVLANGESDDGRIFPNNLRNKPMFVVNGGQ